jgi:Predicted integral membrane protein (DUF2269)
VCSIGCVSEWVVLLHVAVSFWFVAGLLGRSVTLARARSANDLSTLVELVDLSGRFERLMVIPGSIAVVVAGLLAAWAEGQPLAGADDWWLLTSLILFVAMGVLVPTVFLPHGKVFEVALEDAKQRSRSKQAARVGEIVGSRHVPSLRQPAPSGDAGPTPVRPTASDGSHRAVYERTPVRKRDPRSRV